MRLDTKSSKQDRVLSRTNQCACADGKLCPRVTKIGLNVPLTSPTSLERLKNSVFAPNGPNLGDRKSLGERQTSIVGHRSAIFIFVIFALGSFSTATGDSTQNPMPESFRPPWFPRFKLFSRTSRYIEANGQIHFTSHRDRHHGCRQRHASEIEASQSSS